MAKHNPETIIKEVTEALRGSVPEARYNETLTALKRCQEMIGRLAATILDLDKDQTHGELMLEAKLYANILGGFFEEMNRDWLDISNGYDPREYLTRKGVLKPENPTRAKMEERLAEDRKMIEDKIQRLLAEADLEEAQMKEKRRARYILQRSLRNQQILAVAQAELAAEKQKLANHKLPEPKVQPLHEYVNELRAEHGLGPIKPRKGGRPLGSKNKPKVGVVPKAAIGPLYPNALKRAKTKTGGRK